MKFLLTVALVCAAVSSGVARNFSSANAEPPQKPARLAVTGGDHLLYVGTYAGTVQIFDEATEQKIGDITLKTGIPRSLTLSQNRSKFYVLDSTLEKIEVVDIATRLRTAKRWQRIAAGDSLWGTSPEQLAAAKAATGANDSGAFDGGG